MAKIQINLLPDIKMAYEKTRKTQQRVVAIVVLISAISLGLFLIMFVLSGPLQKTLISNADKDITNYNSQIQAIPNIGKILTIQKQLASLPTLHQQKHITSRLFDDLPQLLPPNTSINQLSLDNSAHTMNITGSADTVATVNALVDTLKFTNFTTSADSKTKLSAFTSVVLASINRDSQKASFTINTIFDPKLFDSAATVTLQVPVQLTTRSITNAPPLFSGQESSGSSQSTDGSTSGNTNTGGGSQ